MRAMTAAGGTAVFLLLAPGTVAGLIPWLITRWHFAPPLFDLGAMRLAGVVAIAVGLVMLIDSFVRFAASGGTPAPVAAPQRLVTDGFYRFVRNPMYIGVIFAILGEALLFVDARLFVYAVVVALAFDAFVRFYEETQLTMSFRWAYVDYCEGVPRWLPRLSPWPGPARQRPIEECRACGCGGRRGPA